MCRLDATRFGLVVSETEQTPESKRAESLITVETFLIYVLNIFEASPVAEETKETVARLETWFRRLMVTLFAFIYGVAEMVLVAVVVVQFGFALITRERNEKLLVFGESLSRFIFQILRFVTFNTDDKPFSFSDWPSPHAPLDE